MPLWHLIGDRDNLCGRLEEAAVWSKSYHACACERYVHVSKETGGETRVDLRNLDIRYIPRNLRSAVTPLSSVPQCCVDGSRPLLLKLLLAL